MSSMPPSLGGLNLSDLSSKQDMNATSSNFSVASRRSNFTTITLRTDITGMGGK